MLNGSLPGKIYWRGKRNSLASETHSAPRRDLPWVKIDKEYSFDGPNGKETLADLFDGRSQLIVYHFMLGPGWEEGCKSCSYLADHFDGANWHLPHRDVTFVVVSRAPLAEIQAYQKRMGWRFKWLSSHGNDFNFDYHVSATEEEKKKDKMYYNYETGELLSDEMPGLSVLQKTNPAMSFTAIRLTRAGSTSWLARTTFSISCQRAATKIRSQRWIGSAATMNIDRGETRRAQ